ncbi:hypothetical protein GUJ93_ZPchr0001g30445 [Zizania palustris]|uniref:Uncharacterized protein n=1 Tax=Zizania palustris TaxID=103762 RepID=A0A8J5RN64_ZIZPA|nr:hypothetical protein GUJ93_ZPchr0001g30445 [Zizania palustris]
MMILSRGRWQNIHTFGNGMFVPKQELKPKRMPLLISLILLELLRLEILIDSSLGVGKCWWLKGCEN